MRKLIRRALTLLGATVKAYLFYAFLEDGIIVYSLLPTSNPESSDDTQHKQHDVSC
jgi:hypothetical protein